MTFLELQTRCRTRFQDAAQAVVVNATWKEHLNVAHKNFLAEADFFMEEASTTLSFAANDKSKPLPTGVYRVLNVRDTTNKVKLWPIEGWAKQVELYPDRDNSTAPPRHYRVIQDDLHLYPFPDAATVIEIFYRQEPADWDGADGSSPILPLRYQDALVHMALSMAHLDDGNYEAAGAYSAAYESFVQQAVREMTSVKHERYPRIQDDFYGEF